eukprot:69723_1
MTTKRVHKYRHINAVSQGDDKRQESSANIPRSSFVGLTSFISNQFNLRTLLSLTWMINVVVVNGFTRECKQFGECYNEEIQCLEGEPCTIICSGFNACFESLIRCPEGEDCNVICSGFKSCSGHISAIINANATGHLSVVCSGESSCEHCVLRGQQAQSIYVDASGDGALLYSHIYCPDQATRQGTSDDCVVHIHDATYSNGDYFRIYAVHSFDDITLTYTNCTNCLTPIMYCLDFSWTSGHFCTMNLTNDRWQCRDSESNSICNQYLYPTNAPTLTTSLPSNAPSISPIKYPIYSSDHTLYVRQGGCDFGDCSSDSSRYDLYCKNNDFYNGEFGACCSPYGAPDPPINRTSDEPTDCEGSVLSINDTTIYHKNAFTTADPINEWRSLCFYVEPDFICHSPKIEVQFEKYWKDKSHDHLNIGYKNLSNVLNTEQRINDGFDACGTFKHCALDAYAYLGDPGDDPWLNGFKTFYAIHTAGSTLERLCYYNATLDVTSNVRMSVDCRTTKQFACGSLDYSIDCLNGLMNMNCSAYDGNGEIDIGEGLFYLNRTVVIKHKQMIVKGAGYTSGTVLQHISDQNVLIDCEWQCHLTLQTLQYSTSIHNASITITNGGHMTFDRVLFEDYHTSMTSLLFVIDGMATNVTFLGCEFRNNQMNQSLFFCW